MLKSHLMTTASRKLQTQFKTVHRSVKVRKYLCCTMWLAEATAGALRYGWQITRGSCTCRVLRSREVARQIVAVEKQLARNCLGGLGSSTNFFSHVDVVVILPRSEWAWRYVVCCRLWHSASGDVRLAVHYLPFSCTATVSSGCCSSCCSPSAYSPVSASSPALPPVRTTLPCWQMLGTMGSVAFRVERLVRFLITIDGQQVKQQLVCLRGRHTPLRRFRSGVLISWISNELFGYGRHQHCYYCASVKSATLYGDENVWCSLHMPCSTELPRRHFS